MKAIKLLFLSALFILAACSDKEKSNIKSDSLIGTWVQIERAYSIGGPLIIEEVDNGETYIIEEGGTAILISDSEYTGTWDINEDALRFSFTLEEDRIVDFTYLLKGDELRLTPRFKICIEGCYNRYKRQ